MRLLHVADRWTDRGGAYQYLHDRIATQKTKDDVSVWVGSLDPEAREPGCPLTVVPGLEARGREPVALPEASFDGLHVHNVVNPEALERLGALEGARRLTVQDHRFFCPGRGKLTAKGTVCREAMCASVCRDCFSDEAYYREIYRLTSERLDALAAFELEVLSHYMKRELVAVGVPEDRIGVVRPEVAFENRADIDPVPRCVLFVGRLVEAKGVRAAVEVYERSGVSLPLVFAGTGPLRGELERAGFTVLGWLPREAMPSVYHSAAVLLMPSLWQEPFGIAGLEAQTLGVPVVAWESGGVTEWHRGARIPWGDVEGLAQALRDAVSCPPATEHRAR